MSNADSRGIEYRTRSDRWHAERADDIEWLALEHGIRPKVLADMLGPDATIDEICLSCTVWLTGTERTVCGYCRDW